MVRAALLLLGLTACSDGREVLEDTGRACAYDALARIEGPHLFPENQPVHVRVETPVAGCPTEIRGTCDVELVGSDLVVTSAATWRENAGPCTREAKYATAECVSPAVPEGRYTVRFGDAAVKLNVPDEQPHSPCVESP